MSKASKLKRAKQYNAKQAAQAAMLADYADTLNTGKRKRKVKSQGVGTTPTGKRNHALKDGKAGILSRSLSGFGKIAQADDKTAAQASTNFKLPVSPKWARSKLATEANRKRAGTI